MSDDAATDVKILEFDTSPEAMRESLQAVLMANAQLRAKLSAGVALNQELVNTLGSMVEAHGLVDESRGGKTLRISEKNVGVLNGSLLRVKHEDGFIYYTVAYGVPEAEYRNPHGTILRRH